MLVATSEQLTTALALIELDGIARRITLAQGDLKSEDLGLVVADAGILAAEAKGVGQIAETRPHASFRHSDQGVEVSVQRTVKMACANEQAHMANRPNCRL